VVTDRDWFLNTRVLCSNQILHMISTIRESNAFLLNLGTRFRDLSHQSMRWSSRIGARPCHPLHRRHLNQSSRLKRQPRNKWSDVSAHYEHKTHGSWLSKPCLCKRLDAQIRSYKTSKRNVLHFPDTRTFQSSLAPSVACWPRKRAWYTDLDEYMPDGSHCQTVEFDIARSSVISSSCSWRCRYCIMTGVQ
jgi:hypothetical protein